MRQPKALALWAAGLLPIILSGCSGAPSPKVKITYTDIKPEAPAAVTPPAAPEPEAARADGTLPTLGAPISTKEAMERALAWAGEGLRAYERSDYDAARKSLTDARIILLEADLPVFLENQGLGALRAGLPEELQRYDIEAIGRELEKTDKLTTAEQVERAFVDREVRRILWQFGDTSPDPKEMAFLIDETYNYIGFFRGRYREFFERAFLRKPKYWPIIQEVFTAKKIPPDLGYVALVESGFSPRAVSHADAYGVWQFIPETGQRYGLMNGDDLRDVRKSTTAAADYLLDLISIFGSRSFLLATAAYNAGEGKIIKCLRQIDDPFQKRSFWQIRGCLALETQEYVPRIMAAAVIGADPKRFGFNLPSDEEMRQRYDVVVVPQVTSLARLAELAGVGLYDLRVPNTDLDSAAVMTPGRNFPLYVPVGTSTQIAAALLAAPVVPTVATPTPVEMADREPVSRPTTRTHVVRRGETLFRIADKYNLDLKTLASRNGLRKPYTLSVGQRLQIPGGGGTSTSSSTSSTGSSTRLVYTVRAGNSLDDVAAIFGVTEGDIKAWNDLKSTRLKSGQKLTIHPPTATAKHTYKVRSGDTLSEIATRLRVTVESLMIANGLRSSALRVGQQLVAYVR
jgi:membrane-bound lytic murein transglycosylase D